MKKLICFLLAAACFIPAAIAAQSTTYTWALDRKGNFVHTQDAYLPERTVTDLMLKEPEDMFIAADGYMYICDTGNRRVVVYDTKQNEIVREITHEGFQRPRGIYITRDMDLYVADSMAAAVFRFDRNDNLIQTFDRPDSAAFGNTAYAPMRVAIDNRGSLYVVGEGVSNGIIQLSVTGEFLGFFTSNKVKLTFIQVLQNIFFTDAQKKSLMDRVPGTFSNVHTDSQGIVHTVTMGRDGEEVLKKHNMKGSNIFAADGWDTYSDLTTDQNGIVYTSASNGWISAYTPDGNFIFDFGGYSTADIAGLFEYLTSIAVEADGTLWALDLSKAYLQSYKPTDYTLSIYEAITRFNEGRYTEAEEIWNTVLRYNQSSVLAHDGIGRAGLYTQNYQKAEMHFELAGNRTYYSQAYWELRNDWLQQNLIWILLIIVALVLTSLILRYADKKKRVKLAIGHVTHKIGGVYGIRDFVFAFSVMRHPLDAYYDLKRKNKGSYGGATLLYLLLFIVLLLYQTSKAFIFQMTDVQDMNLLAIMGGLFGVILLFIVCNYLVTSINDGEGSIGDIYKMVAYASMPITVSFGLITVISYGLTENERFLVTFIQLAGIAWFCVVMYLGLQEMHNYSLRNTVKSILFTALFIAIAIVVLLILTVLFQQIAQFVQSVGREVYYNANGTI